MSYGYEGDAEIHDPTGWIGDEEGARVSKFEVGDKVQMPGIPFVVEVLEIGTCEETDCDMGRETFRFKDPGGLGDDWEHADNFEKADR